MALCRSEFPAHLCDVLFLIIVKDAQEAKRSVAKAMGKTKQEAAAEKKAAEEAAKEPEVLSRVGPRRK